MFGVILVWHAAVSALMAATGPSGLEFALLPTWAAVSVAEGKGVRTVSLLAIGVAAAWLASRSGGMTAYVGLAAAAGAPIGIAIRRGWRYDHAVGAAALFGIVGVLALVSALWTDWLGGAADIYAAVRSEMEAVADRNADMRYVALVDLTRGVLVDHWSDVGIGIAFWPVLLGCGVSAGAASRVCVARSGKPGLAGGFAEFRAPDALAWGVIALTLAWYADTRLPDVGLRRFAWNGAIAVTAVYWLTGMAVLAYGLRMTRVPFAARAAVYVGVNMLFGMPMPAAVGLSDTWVDFRGRLQRWAEARRADSEPDGPDGSE